MYIVLKGIIHLVLLVAFVWFGRFIVEHVKAIREGLREGMDEGRLEVAQELDEEERLNFLKSQVPLVERIALAIAAPFRVAQVESNLESISLYQVGQLDSKKKEALKETLERDFGFPDAYDKEPVSTQMMELLLALEDTSHWGEVLLRSIQLFILTASADLGYIQFYNYSDQAAAFIAKIQNANLHSWKEFADRFLKEEKEAELNSFAGRSFLRYWISRLLNGQGSPWKLPWETVLNFEYIQTQFIPLEKQKELLDNWQGLDSCIASKRIMEDGCKVGSMDRSEPVTVSDSGWCFLAGDETEEYMADISHFGAYSLNNVCNHDQAVIPYLTAPYGTRFERTESEEFCVIEAEQENEYNGRRGIYQK
ncbi:MAG: DUF2185 domain-containing protein [Lachnospiraceae bacterium]